MSKMNDKQSDDESITTLSYTDLIKWTAKSETDTANNEAISVIGQAFGDHSTSLGIIAITDVPNYPALRSKLLQISHQFATQTPQKSLDKLTKEETFYSVGWSHGKEKLEGDKLDMGKGSFYANPLTDSPIESILKRDFDCMEEDEETQRRKSEFLEMAEQNPAFYAPNVWPSEEVPEMENLVKDMGKLIQGVGIMVAKLCDGYVAEKVRCFVKGQCFVP